jgi:hypothetical protein
LQLRMQTDTPSRSILHGSSTHMHTATCRNPCIANATSVLSKHCRKAGDTCTVYIPWRTCSRVTNTPIYQDIYPGRAHHLWHSPVRWIRGLWLLMQPGACQT